MKPVDRRDVLGCPVDAVSFADAATAIHQAVLSRASLRLVAINVDQIMKARRDPEFARLLWEADLAFADGVPVVWAAALLGTPVAGRVSGTDLVWRCARISAETDRPMALVGARPGVAARAAHRLMQETPGSRVSAIPTPFPLGPAESLAIAAAIREQDAGIVLVALGAPRQERWIAEHLGASGAAVGVGVGSAFDIIAGDQPRAPRWMQASGLEWLHRTILDPRRLGRRYLIEDSPFFWHVAWACARDTLAVKRDHR